ncbi:hypothetical protein QWZ14_29535 [Paeniroseomonas aquatica]|uniref:Uncharacterized protein n=1 Tax=Paeniroseomonas aquatica TaxID=373043 RepID=A0ABT8AFG5_9PROT|nr:hypothetical protein [Paeniroseomonas aquatica]MDN3568539.1 hypothetical protein [Paeniroseomonas aquatica]
MMEVIASRCALQEVCDAVVDDVEAAISAQPSEQPLDDLCGLTFRDIAERARSR